MSLDCISAMNLGYISAHVVADLEMRIGLSKVRGALIAECRDVLLQDVVGGGYDGGAGDAGDPPH